MFILIHFAGERTVSEDVHTSQNNKHILTS